MAETFKFIFLLVLNIALIGAGIVVTRRKHAAIGIGGRSTKPAFIITLTGAGATIFGVAYIIGGIITLIPTIMLLISKDDSTLETAMTITTAILLIIVVGGFIIGALIQLFIGLMEILEANKSKN
jgi:hypothetical protein